MNEQLTVHIVSFDIPLPADYGGVIDVFHKITHLHQANISVILHCFYKDRIQQDKLYTLCKKVYYYKRDLKKAHLSLRPYIIASRNDKELLVNLCRDNYPIIFEGMHTCYFIDHPLLKNRNKIVRLHNIEHEYYTNLYHTEENLLKKFFFKIESAKLKFALKILSAATSFWAITPKEKDYFQKLFPKTPILLVNPFTNSNELNSKTGQGTYVLYHGNLSIPENIDSALFVLNHIAGKVDLPIIMAGKNPPETLLKAAEAKKVKIHANPSESDLNELIRNAHINLVYSKYNSGLKLKLLTCLYNGRFCIANDLVIKNTFLEKTCIRANSSDEFIQTINNLKDKEFKNSDLEMRSKNLTQAYDMQKDIKKIIASLAKH